MRIIESPYNVNRKANRLPPNFSHSVNSCFNEMKTDEGNQNYLDLGFTTDAETIKNASQNAIQAILNDSNVFSQNSDTEGIQNARGRRHSMLKSPIEQKIRNNTNDADSQDVFLAVNNSPISSNKAVAGSAPSVIRPTVHENIKTEKATPKIKAKKKMNEEESFEKLKIKFKQLKNCYERGTLMMENSFLNFQKELNRHDRIVYRGKMSEYNCDDSTDTDD